MDDDRVQSFEQPTETKRVFRAMRAAIICDSRTKEENPLWVERFSTINIPILAVEEFVSIPEAAHEFDIVGLIGPADKLSKKLAEPKTSYETRVAFVPFSRFRDCRNYLEIADAAVHCQETARDSKGHWDVAYHFFESITVPSMLNIDLADLQNIATGIGIAYSDYDDTTETIIERLPKTSRLAKSALLHFTCSDDVTLREIYSISKALAWRGREIAVERNLSKDSTNTKKYLRKLNIKMGIRIANRIEDEQNVAKKRIRVTAILFGIQQGDFRTKRFRLV